MTAHRRLLQAILSYLLGIAVRIVVQLATLPILFAYWSATRVGTWMVIFALPAYFVVAGQAFSGAGGTAALAAAREERWDEARAAFRASWIWATSATLLVAAGLAALALLVPDELARDLGFTGAPELRACALWLGIYVLAVCQSSLMLVPLRVSGRYPQHVMFQSVASLAEIAVLAACVTTSQSFGLLAASLAVLRVAITGLQTVLAFRASPALFAPGRIALRTTLRQLVRPSLAFMILPLVYVLNLQGYTLLVGFAFGAQVVAGFVATRVIVRAIDLVMTVLYTIQFNEAGYLGDGKREFQRRQLATMTALTLAATIGFALVIVPAGPWLQSVLSAGKSQFDPAIALVLLASGSIRALGTTPQAIVAADNGHVHLANRYLVASILALVGAAALAVAGFGLPAILAMLVPAELMLALPAMRAALRHLGWDTEGLARALVSRERVADIAQLARFLVHRG
ncbi:hypothetical protein [Qipengyuania zhejiangensis]|uniref:hypothetical protein n=1 Tax=Qipengyuania zhejiangensis TaxID=3077782 RepID=UPI002D79619A|nr:hypothetical protein [Qipengyuania sp. Z2]